MISTVAGAASRSWIRRDMPRGSNSRARPDLSSTTRGRRADGPAGGMASPRRFRPATVFEQSTPRRPVTRPPPLPGRRSGRASGNRPCPGAGTRLSRESCVSSDLRPLRPPLGCTDRCRRLADEPPGPPVPPARRPAPTSRPPSRPPTRSPPITPTNPLEPDALIPHFRHVAVQVGGPLGPPTGTANRCSFGATRSSRCVSLTGIALRSGRCASARERRFVPQASCFSCPASRHLQIPDLRRSIVHRRSEGQSGWRRRPPPPS